MAGGLLLETPVRLRGSILIDLKGELMIFTLLQLFLAAAMFDVWLFRYRTPGAFRGGDAKTMEEEFEVYGLPDWFRKVVRVLKLTAGVLMIAGIWHELTALSRRNLACGPYGGSDVHAREGQRSLV